MARISVATFSAPSTLMSIDDHITEPRPANASAIKTSDTAAPPVTNYFLAIKLLHCRFSPINRIFTLNLTAIPNMA
jgi:hypothetical protein